MVATVIAHTQKMTKNMKYRSSTEIVAMMLDAANGAETKTKIIYKSYLSYHKLKE